LRRSVVLVLCAITTALSAITAFFPFVFFLPVLIVITLQNWKVSIYSGLMFGLLSFAYSYVRVSVVSVFFQANPLLAIVPRFLAAVLAHLAYKGIYKVSKSRVFAASVCGVVGSICNTLFVIGGLVLFADGYVYSGINMLFEAIAAVFVGNALIEIILGFVVVPPISAALYKSKKIRSMLFAQKAIINENLDSSVDIQDNK